MKKIGLILEGGGMRGVYTAGVLDLFMEEEIHIPYVYGVSSGANNGINYIANQKGRSKNIFFLWSQDKRFISLENLIKEGSYFGMDFIFDELPNKLEKFDYKNFVRSKKRLRVCASNCDTGEAEYFKSESFCPYCYMNKALRASSSLPIISPSVQIGEVRFVDGVITDPLPIRRSLEEGNEYNIVVLTKKHNELVKHPFMDKVIIWLSTRRYPKLKEAILQSTEKYNHCLRDIKELEEAGKVFLFKPQEKILKSRYKKDVFDIQSVYQQGYIDAKTKLIELKKWMEEDEISSI